MSVGWHGSLAALSMEVTVAEWRRSQLLSFHARGCAACQGQLSINTWAFAPLFCPHLVLPPSHFSFQTKAVNTISHDVAFPPLCNLPCKVFGLCSHVPLGTARPPTLGCEASGPPPRYRSESNYVLRFWSSTSWTMQVAAICSFTSCSMSVATPPRALHTGCAHTAALHVGRSPVQQGRCSTGISPDAR